MGIFKHHTNYAQRLDKGILLSDVTAVAVFYKCKNFVIFGRHDRHEEKSWVAKDIVFSWWILRDSLEVNSLDPLGYFEVFINVFCNIHHPLFY